MADDWSNSLSSKFETKKHISFLLRCLRLLPQPYTSADDQRMTLGYFAISGLDLLHATDKIPPEEKKELADWVYEQQARGGGFRGGPSTSPPPPPPLASSSTSSSGSTATTTAGASYEAGNLAMTYAALLILAVLKDDFTRLHRKKLVEYVGALQDKREGGFAAEIPPKAVAAAGIEGEGEEGVDRDPRFTYCALAICSMLGEWETIDVAKVRKYLEQCQRYDGGFGASSTHESHSGMTYCCIASLHLLPPLPTSSPPPPPANSSGPLWERREEALTWLAHRQVASSTCLTDKHDAKAELHHTASSSQDGEEEEEEEEEEELVGGFQGRPSKLPPDVCYSFWNGGALQLLGEHELIDAKADAEYVLSAQSRVGGIAKIPYDHPDLLHTYLGLASLSLHQPAAAAPSQRKFLPNGDDNEHKEAEEKGEAEAEAEGGLEFGMNRLDAAWNCSLEAKEWILAHLTNSK